MDKPYCFEDLVKIIDALRAEGGCPWDREQTHDSLKKCLMDEATETIAAIDLYKDTGSSENLCEELGDVLLQVMLHSRIAKEEKEFDINDVIQILCEKMIRRHPHVFGKDSAKNSGQVLEKWEDIKRKEREMVSEELEKRKKLAMENARQEVRSYFK